MEGKHIFAAFIVIAIILLLIMWWMNFKYVGAVFLWFVFVFVIMCVAKSRCLDERCLQLLLLVGLVPVIVVLLFTVFNCHNDKKPMDISR